MDQQETRPVTPDPGSIRPDGGLPQPPPPATPEEARARLRAAAAQVRLMPSNRSRRMLILGGALLAGLVIGRYPAAGRAAASGLLAALKQAPGLIGAAALTGAAAGGPKRPSGGRGGSPP